MSTIDGFIFYSDGASKTRNGLLASYGLHGYAYSYDAPKTGTGDPKVIPTGMGYQHDNGFTELKPVTNKDSELYKKYSEELPEHIRANKNTKQITLDSTVKVTPLAYIDEYGLVLGEQTNNRAELTGFIQALSFIADDGLESFYHQLAEIDPKILGSNKILSLIVLSDSKYVVEGSAEFLPKWKANGYCKRDGSPIASLDLWKIVEEKLEKLETLNVFLQVGYVAGHAGNVGNVKADHLANIGHNAIGHGSIKLPSTLTKQSFLNSPKGYWNPSSEYNRLINLPSCYYNVYKKDDTDPVVKDILDTHEWNGNVFNAYAFGYHGKLNKEFGKPIAEGSLSILLLKDKIPEIEILKDSLSKRMYSKYIEISIGKVQQALMGKNAVMLKQFGWDCLTNGNKVEIIREEGCRETEIAEILNPPLLARIGILEINKLFEKLKTYLFEKTLNVPAPTLTVTDVTGAFFFTDTSGKKPIVKLKKDFTNIVKSIPLKVKYRKADMVSLGEIEIPFRFGIEIIDRNNLNAIAEKNPSMFVITWHEGLSDTALHLQYATIIECDGEYGIWAGNYSNNCLIPLQ